MSGITSKERRLREQAPAAPVTREQLSAPHFCRINGLGQPTCTCGWAPGGHFDSGGARHAEIDHLISVGRNWSAMLADQR